MENTITKIIELKKWYEKRIKHFEGRMEKYDNTPCIEKYELSGRVTTYEIVVQDLTDMLDDIHARLLELEKDELTVTDYLYHLWVKTSYSKNYQELYDRHYKKLVELRKQIKIIEGK